MRHLSALYHHGPGFRRYTGVRMPSAAHDLTLAWRGLLRSPGFTLAAILSVAIGVGANTAIFTVARALLLRPLPYADADRLVILWNRSPGLDIAEDWFSTAQYFDILRGHGGFDAVAIAIGHNVNLTGDGEPERIGAVRMSSNLLPMLGVRPAHGRLFLPADDVEGAPASALLNHGTWTRRYGGDPRVVGRTLTLNGEPHEIVGVLPAGFSLPREAMPTLGGAEDAEVVLPLPLGEKAAQIRGREDYNILGKLRPGVTLAAAQAEMDGITARLRREYPEIYPPNGGLTFGIVPLREQVVGDVRRPLLVLMAAVCAVLLIACANVANLVLSRSIARQRDIAVRAALGASRGRLLRHLLADSLLLALAGGAAGLLLARWSLAGLHALGTRSVPRLQEIGLDGTVLLFALGLSLAAGLLFGLLPAWRATSLDIHATLKDASRGAAGSGLLWGRGGRLRRLLVAAEIALCVVLLIAAGLLVRSFAGLLDVPPGFNPRGVLTLELTMSGRRYAEPEAVVEAYRRIWERLRALPGVSAAGGVSALPLSQMFAWGPITVEGRTPPPGEKFINADMRFVGGDYFRAMEIPLVEGRLFTEHDTRAAPRVAIVDTHMAQRLWPGESAIGKRIRTGGATSTSPWTTVVGVVGRVKQYTLDADSRIAMYFAHTQAPGRAMNVVVRSQADPAALGGAVRREIAAIDADLPIYRLRTMTERVDESLARRRFAMLLLSLFAAVALGLAAIGTYGVMAYLVSQGARDLAIRMALGATPAAILWLVVRHGLGVACGGVLLGLAGAVVLTQFMTSLLFGVAPFDPLTFTTVPLMLAAVALLASVVPARRAARIDLLDSLSAE